MSYSKTTDFTVKDSLLAGNPNKIIRGSEIDNEFDAIETESLVVDARLAVVEANQAGVVASTITIADAGNYFSSGDVEGALQEVGQDIASIVVGGTLAWQIKTANYTAIPGDRIMADTSGGSFTITLPVATTGATVTIADYAGTFGTNNLTVGRNGSNINGDAEDFILDIPEETRSFDSVDATLGWKVI